MKKLRSNVKSGARIVLAVLAVSVASSLAQAAPATPEIHQKHRPVAGTAAEACGFCIAMVLADRLILATPPVFRLHQAFELLYATTDAGFVHLKSAGAVAEPARAPHA